MCTLVLPGLYVSGFEESFRCPDSVTHVLNVAAECEVSERVGRTYLACGVPDDCPDTDIRTILPPCIDFIHAAHAAGGTVLVHCLEGISRSVCVVVAYMVAALGWE